MPRGRQTLNGSHGSIEEVWILVTDLLSPGPPRTVQVEWRSSVQPSLGEKLQLHLERSLLEKQELECRALRAEKNIQDLKQESKDPVCDTGEV